MATRTATAAQTRSAIQFEVALEDFTGKDGREGRVLKFGPVDTRFPKFNFAPRTWVPLFTTKDTDGDSNLFNIFSSVVSEADSHEDADAIVQGMLHAMEQFKAWYLERYEEEAPGLEDVEVGQEPEPETPTQTVQHITEQPAPGQQVTQHRIITAAEEANFRKLLKTQSGIFQRATHDQQDLLVLDAWQVCAVEGMKFPEYRASLAQFGTAGEYISAID